MVESSAFLPRSLGALSDWISRRCHCVRINSGAFSHSLATHFGAVATIASENPHPNQRTSSLIGWLVGCVRHFSVVSTRVRLDDPVSVLANFGSVLCCIPFSIHTHTSRVFFAKKRASVPFMETCVASVELFGQNMLMLRFSPRTDRNIIQTNRKSVDSVETPSIETVEIWVSISITNAHSC